MKITTFIILFFIILSCKSQKITKTDYKLVNVVIDSLVKESRKDTIGLRIETFNSRLGEETIFDPGFMKYENGTSVLVCPKSYIKDSIYSKFNYEKFKSKDSIWDIAKIKNKSVITDFTLKR